MKSSLEFQLGELKGQVSSGFIAVNQRFDSLEQQVREIRSSCATKEYADAINNRTIKNEVEIDKLNSQIIKVATKVSLIGSGIGIAVSQVLSFIVNRWPF